MPAECVRADQYVALRQSSAKLSSTSAPSKVLTRNSKISLGKHGLFPANLIIGRPFYLTYELLSKSEDGISTSLRIVPASELHAEALAEDGPSAAESRDEPPDVQIVKDEDRVDVVAADGRVLVRNNRLTVDDASRQALTREEIEELKRVGTGSGRAIIEKIMQSHSAIDEKTSFSLAKYTMRKAKKYLRRFTVLPLDVSMLAHWMLHEREPAKIMDLREETLGLIASWANAHCHALEGEPEQQLPGGRYLVVDDTGGLIVASLAERMGLLDHGGEDEAQVPTDQPTQSNQPGQGLSQQRRTRPNPDDYKAADFNTITVVHAATQANYALLEYLGFDPNDPDISHPLYTHLHAVSFLQLLDPSSSALYADEPEVLDAESLAQLKTSKRGNYYRKRRRWERTRKVVDDVRAGGLDALIVATHMDLANVMHHLVPLVRGGGQVVVYAPSLEPVTQLADLYSSARRTAFINAQRDGDERASKLPNEDFPLDPRLLLAPMLQTARARQWQVLPGRTHPLMTSRGGPEGYIFTATRVIPAEGAVEARGKFQKKRAAADAMLDGVSPSKRV